MAVQPTKLSAGQMSAGVLSGPPADWRFLLSRSNSSRSMDEITLVQRDEPYLPGMFVSSGGVAVDGTGTVPLVAADIDGIICAYTDCRAGPRMATVVTRDAEVEDAYLIYGALVVKDVNQRLSQLAIIVRQAVLPNTTPGTFDPAKAGTPPVTGIPSSTPPVPPATLPYPQPASFFPTTLEAAEPDMPGAGSPNVAPPTVPPADEPLTRREGESDEDFRARQEAQRQERERRERERTPPAPSPPPPEAPRT